MVLMIRLSATLLIAAAAFAQTPPAPQKKAAPPATTPAATTPAGPAREPGLFAIFNTSMGTIVAKLFEKETPLTVQNFIALARGTKAWKDPKTGTMIAKPLYNGVTFHRVIPDFMIQTGDPTATGSHDCGFTIKDEILPTLKFDQPGRLAMANTGNPNSGACQIFLTEGPRRQLDPESGNGAYTIFGQVVEGVENIGKIARVPRDRNDKPNVAVKVITVTIKREGPPPPPPAAAKKAGTPGVVTKKSTAPVAPPAPVKK
jgi:peptidyl-prolyl cis-trans isomerase A (cyclophilin A)